MRLWVLTRGDYESYEVVGVTEREDVANEWERIGAEEERNYFEATPYDTDDDINLFLRAGVYPYAVRKWPDKNAWSAYANFDGVDAGLVYVARSPAEYGDGYYWEGQVYARNRGEAASIADTMRRRAMAKGVIAEGNVPGSWKPTLRKAPPPWVREFTEMMKSVDPVETPFAGVLTDMSKSATFGTGSVDQPESEDDDDRSERIARVRRGLFGDPGGGVDDGQGEGQRVRGDGVGERELGE